MRCGGGERRVKEFVQLNGVEREHGCENKFGMYKTMRA